MISREVAKEIGRLDALAHCLGHSVRDVRCFDEIGESMPLLYNVNLENCWVVYIEQIGHLALQPSVIVVVDRENGGILYRGSAHDEG